MCVKQITDNLDIIFKFCILLKFQIQFLLKFDFQMATSSQQINKIISQFMNQAKQALSQIIVSMQSDQLLQQMRNDSNLYEQKIKYIKQIIKDQFVFETVNEKLLNQINQLKTNKQQIEARLEDSKLQYIEELSNIQIQYKQFLVQKENQKKQMYKEIQQKKQQIFMLKKQFYGKSKDTQMQIQNLKRQIQTLKSKQKDLRIDVQQSLLMKQTLQQQIKHLKSLQLEHDSFKNTKYAQLQRQAKLFQKTISVQKGQINELNQKIESLSVTLAQQKSYQQEYIATIEKMKQDMFLIKQEWEKKCLEIQKTLQQDYRNKLIDHQQQMHEKLQLYMEEIKMGKNIIIQSSEEILESKRMLMEDRFNAQVKRYQQDLQNQTAKLKQLQSKYQNLKQTVNLKNQELKQTKSYYESQLKSKEGQFTKTQQQLNKKLSTLKQQSAIQVERLRKTQSMLLKDLKQSKQQKEEIQKQVSILRDQFNIYKDKQQKQTTKLKELQMANQTSTGKILELKKDIAIMNEKNTMNQKSIKQKNTQISRLQTTLNALRNQYKELDNMTRKIQVKLAEANVNLKQMQRQKQQNIKKFDKLYVLVRKLSKQLTLTKQDLLFIINVQRSKISNLMIILNEQFNQSQQKIVYKHKLNIKSLLDQVQAQKRQQKQDYDVLERQNQNMKKQIKILQKIMEQKQEDHAFNRERVVNLQVEKCRLIMQEEISKQRDQKRKIQQKMYNQQKKHQYMLAKAEKQVSKQIRSFISKWENNLEQLQHNLNMKSKQLKESVIQIKKVNEELDTTKETLSINQQKLNKFQKKYQSLKQQRDKTVDQLMKRLEKQTKNKLNLEKQIKQIRGQIVKTNSNTTSPFNHYSFIDRQNNSIYTNAFQATTHQKTTKNTSKTNLREKQLSQIRQMIAKTYKVVEGPQKDSTIQRGKLF